MLVMIFVNDLASVRGLPWWTYHMPEGQNGMTYVDVVFPAFLFLVGLSIPLAIGSRLKKQPSRAKLWAHVVWRTVSLLVLGIILANARSGDARYLHMRSTLWAFLCLVAAFGFWSAYPKTFRWAPVCRWVSAVVLLGLLGLFRRKTESGGTAWLDFSYWEILGIIGWAYLSACLLYIPTRRFRWAPLVWFGLCLGLNVAAHSGLWRWLFEQPPYVWPFGAGDAVMIVVAGVCVTAVFRTGWTGTALFGGACALAGWFLRPLGIAKNEGTPTWCLWSIAISVAVFLAMRWICDEKGYTRWAAFLRPAGASPLTTYLVPDLYYYAVAGTSFEGWMDQGAPGVLRGVVFTAAMLLIAMQLTRSHIRLQL